MCGNYKIDFAMGDMSRKTQSIGEALSISAQEHNWHSGENEGLRLLSEWQRNGV